MNRIDIENINKNLQKIIMYCNDELLKIDYINNNFKNINNFLETSNILKLEQIQFELINKLKKISKMHENSYLIIKKKINIYDELISKTNLIFEDIYRGNKNE